MFAIIVFGLAAISVPAGGSAAAPDVRAVPAKLVGKWTRKITSSDVFRVQATSFLAGNGCTLRIWKRGPAHLDCTNLGLTGRILPDGPNLVHILDAGPGVDDVFKTTNLYRWRVSARRLTLTTIVDRTPDRAAALWGVWERTSAQSKIRIRRSGNNVCCHNP
ncbi:MAG: hypothetical protein ACRDPV_06305 [Gaiellaceae bacterium]